MSITATVENDTIKLPVHVPDGTSVEIQLLTADASSQWPPTYFDNTSGALAGMLFERPGQGNIPQRDAW